MIKSTPSAGSAGGQQEIVEVKRTMENVYRAFEELNADKLDANFSHSEDLVAFGTDWDEKFVGWSQYKDVHTVQFRALRSFQFKQRELEVHVNGETAWASDRPHWKIETKDGEKVEQDVRVTAVLRREEEEGGGGTRGEWRIVQWHVSVGLGERLHEY
jgi:ketosteroid isomerase-like protein